MSPLSSLAKPTGVGQHALHMFDELSRSNEICFELASSRGDYVRSKEFLSKTLLDCPVHFLPLGERLSRTLFLQTHCFSIDSLCKMTRDDWIYSPKEQPVWTRRAKLAVTVHDVIMYEDSVPGVNTRRPWRQKLIMNRIMRRILDHAELIATVSEFTRERLIDLFQADPDRIAVIGNGVSKTYFRNNLAAHKDVIKKYNLTDSAYFIAVGSLTYRKGGDILLEVAEAIANSPSIDIQIVIAGRRHDADLFQQNESLTNKYPNWPLKLLGYVSDDDLATLLSCSQALLFPSRYEGFGIPVLEGMAAGTRVICSQESALPEISGLAAYHLPEISCESLLSAILSISQESSEQRQQFIDQGRKWAKPNTWERCAARLIQEMQARN